MQRIQYQGRNELCETAELHASLDDGIEWQGTVARRMDRLEVSRPVEIYYGDHRLTLVVADFAERANGTTLIRAVDPTRRAPRYERESFSTIPDGSSIGRAIESRLPVASAPPSLYRLVPAIQVDTTLGQLLDDAAAALGAHWWYDHAGLTIGRVDAEEDRLFGEWVARTPRGGIWRTSGGVETSLPPLPGRSVQFHSSSASGEHGAILQLDARFTSAEWTAELCVGNPPAPLHSSPRATCLVDCTVVALDPFEVEYESGAGRVIRTQAVPLGIAASGDQVRLKLPIAIGDRGLLQLDVLGVARRAPRYWPLHASGPLPTTLTIKAPSLIVEVNEQTHHSRQVSYPDAERFSIA